MDTAFVPATPTRLQAQTLRAVGALVAAVVIGEIVATIVLGRGLTGRPGVVGHPVPGGDLLVDVGIVAAGALLTTARPRNAIGWLLLTFGFFGATQNLGIVYGVRASVVPGTHLPFGTTALSLGSSLWIPALFIPVTVLLVLYPDGRLPAQWWRWVNYAAVAGMTFATVAAGTAPQSTDDNVVGGQPVIALPHGLTVTLGVTGAVLLLAAAAISIVGAVVRTVRASSPQRQQLIWLLITAAVAVVIAFLTNGWVFDVALALIPIAVAIGVLRYQLLGIELVIRRTLVYGVLTGLVIGLYAGATAAVSALVPHGPAPVVVAAALVAVLLAPARTRLQRVVDRLVYGARNDPLHAVRLVGAEVSATAEPLPAVVQAVADAVRARYAAVVDVDGHVLAEVGSANDNRIVVPLTVAGERAADLVLCPARGETTLAPADRRTLDALALPVAVVVHAARLNSELAVARQRALDATLEERSRLRRDLHDGLGPSLAGVALGLEAVEDALPDDPEYAEAITRRLHVEVQHAVDDVRRIIDALRPAALDQRGLVGALRERAAVVAQGSRSPLRVDVEAPEELPVLPGAVEVAAYRIADEALTNVIRHAQAGQCRLRIAVNGGLVVEVRDDGRGLSGEPRPDGVGMSSMRRRAEELGGTFHVASDESGSVVVARLPLDAT